MTNTSTCRYCGKAIVKFNHWVHAFDYDNSTVTNYLNRCQSPDVPYGKCATPLGEYDETEIAP